MLAGDSGRCYVASRNRVRFLMELLDISVEDQDGVFKSIFTVSTVSHSTRSSRSSGLTSRLDSSGMFKFDETMDRQHEFKVGQQVDVELAEGDIYTSATVFEVTPRTIIVQFEDPETDEIVEKLFVDFQRVHMVSTGRSHSTSSEHERPGAVTFIEEALTSGICPHFLQGKCRQKGSCERSHKLLICVYCGSKLPSKRISASAHLRRCFKQFSTTVQSTDWMYSFGTSPRV